MPRLKPPGLTPPPRMPPPRTSPPRIPASRMPDRPGWLRLVWKRLRRLMPAGILLYGVVALALTGFYALHASGPGGTFRERLGETAAKLGLRVENVVIEGLNKTPEALVRAALGVHRGDPMLGFSLSEARTRIETINWVQSASVERRLPATIVVKLTERRPFAVWQHQNRFVLIDRNGEVMTDPDVASFQTQVPLVVGPGAPLAAAALLDALANYPPVMTRLQAAVRVGERRWNLRLNNGTDILLPEGAETPALVKLMELQSTYSLLERPLQVVDLRLPDRLVVRPQAEKADPKDTGPKDAGPKDAGAKDTGAKDTGAKDTGAKDAGKTGDPAKTARKPT
jgi:cell division protein FtsQ